LTKGETTVIKGFDNPQGIPKTKAKTPAISSPRAPRKKVIERCSQLSSSLSNSNTSLAVVRGEGTRVEPQIQVAINHTSITEINDRLLFILPTYVRVHAVMAPLFNSIAIPNKR
jgi:tyrosine-protein phosphatase YwqE